MSGPMPARSAPVVPAEECTVVDEVTLTRMQALLAREPLADAGGGVFAERDDDTLDDVEFWLWGHVSGGGSLRTERGGASP